MKRCALDNQGLPGREKGDSGASLLPCPLGHFPFGTRKQLIRFGCCKDFVQKELPPPPTHTKPTKINQR